MWGWWLFCLFLLRCGWVLTTPICSLHRSLMLKVNLKVTGVYQILVQSILCCSIAIREVDLRSQMSRREW